MKKHLMVLALAIASATLKSQSVPMALEDWKTTDGTQNFFFKNVIKTDPSGNTIIAGATMNNGFPDILVAKYSSAGAQLWIKQFAGVTNGIDIAAGLYVNNTDVYVTGAITNNSVTLQTECITMRLSSSTGNTVWSSTYSGSAGIGDLGKFINVNGSGDVFVSGATYNSSFNTDFLVLKYDGTTGAQSWDNSYDYTGMDDGAYRLNFSGSNIIVGGAVTSGANTYRYAALTMAQSTGSLLATNVSTAVTTSSVDAVADLTSDASGYAIIAGSMDVPGQGTNFFVQKLNPLTLASVWIYTWNGAGSLNDYVKGVSTDASDNVYLSGYTSTSGQGRDIVAIKLNSSGVQQWAQIINGSFNGDDEASDIIADASGNSYITGYTTKAANNSNYYTAKFDASGTKIWEKETEGHGYDDAATNIELDMQDNVVITGQSQNSIGEYEFLTAKYVQKDVTVPTDFNGETPNPFSRFYANRGQLLNTSGAAVPDVKFYTHNTTPLFYFQNTMQSLVFSHSDTQHDSLNIQDTLHRIDLTFTSSNSATGTYAMDEKTDNSLNYFLSHTGDKGVSGVYGNDRLITPDLYKNIDLMCNSNQNGIKYYFIVKPGGNPADIQMEFTGASSFSLNPSTNALSVNSAIGSITYDRPTVYQLTAANATVAVTGWTADWQTNGASNKYKFNTGAYTSSLNLVIQVDLGNGGLSPTSTNGNMNYSTFFGGTSGEILNAIKVNQTTNRRYVTGWTTSAVLPILATMFQYNAQRDVIILGYTGTDTLIFGTFYGGSSYDEGTAIAIESTGNVYIGGSTQSLNNPIQIFGKPSATQQASNGYSALGTGSDLHDGFILELSRDGQTHIWSRYLGGVYSDNVSDMVMDNADNLYVVGETASGNFPTITGGAYKTYLQMGTNYGKNIDWHVTKFNSASTVQWGTFYGGDNFPVTGPLINADRATCVDIDNTNGKVYVGGSNGSTDFPSFNNTGNSSSNAFYAPTINGGCGALVRFNSSNGTPDLSTQLLNVRDFNDLRVLTDHSVLMVGVTLASSSTFSHKTKVGAYNKKYFNTDQKGCILQMSSSIDSLWSTFYNKANVSGEYSISRIAPSDNGAFCISGNQYTDSLTIPSTTPPGFYTNSARVSRDGFISYFDDHCQLYHAHYLGSAGADLLNDIDMYKHQSLYAVGMADASNFPIASTPANASLIHSNYSGGDDGFISRFDVSSVITFVQQNSAGNNLSVTSFPNPASDYFFIDTKDLANQDFVLTLYDITGKEIYNQSYFNNTELVKVNCNQLSQGMYLVNVKTKESTFTGKIIKQ